MSFLLPFWIQIRIFLVIKLHKLPTLDNCFLNMTKGVINDLIIRHKDKFLCVMCPILGWLIIIALITELFDLIDLRSTVQRPCLTCGEVRAAARTGYAPAPPTCSSTRRPTSPTVSIPPPNFRCPPFQYLPLYLNFIKPKAMVLILDGIPEIILFYYICWYYAGNSVQM